MLLGIGERLTQVPAPVSTQELSVVEIKHYLAVPEMVHDLVSQLENQKNPIASATARLGQFEVTISHNRYGFFIGQIIDCSHTDVQYLAIPFDLNQIREQILDFLANINHIGHNIVLEPTISYGQRSG